MSDTRWSGRAFGFEPLRGLRYWNVSAEGIITSQHQQFIWTDGDNEAECMGRQIAESNQETFDILSDASQAAIGTRPPGHDMVKCSCGLHALTDRSRLREYAGPYGQLVGVLEGYGEVVQGTLGFRASRGRIVALVAPQRPPNRLDDWGRFWDELHKWKTALLFALYFLVERHAWTVQVFDWATSMVTAGGLLYLACREVGRATRATNRTRAGHIPRAEIQERYPSVRLYDTAEAMLVDFPLSVPSPA